MTGFISLDDAKAQMKVEDSSEDLLIGRFIDAASARVLPPVPEQKSMTCMPGRASHNSAANWEPSS